MTTPKLRWLLDLLGWVALAGGILVFVLLVAYTIYAFTDPQAPYGAYVPILGFGALGGGIVGGGALRLLASIDRRVERLEAAVAASGARS
ncbi:hypothetical protein [Brevundimonas sp.]|uniref:hypothetical protein n=1 Tax=Brevundimonas sp. TaxID=1871086 RepID=UPI002EDABA02